MARVLSFWWGGDDKFSPNISYVEAGAAFRRMLFAYDGDVIRRHIICAFWPGRSQNQG